MLFQIMMSLVVSLEQSSTQIQNCYLKISIESISLPTEEEDLANDFKRLSYLHQTYSTLMEYKMCYSSIFFDLNAEPMSLQSFLVYQHQ